MNFKNYFKLIFFFIATILIGNQLNAGITEVIYSEETSLSSNKNCNNVEIITPLNNVSDSTTVTLTGDTNWGDFDYYQFEIGREGTISIEGTEESGSTYYFKVGSNGCNSDNIYDGWSWWNATDIHKINNIDVLKGDKIYFAVVGDSFWRKDNYNITIKYVTDLKPGEVTSGFAGPEGTIGSDGVVIGVNTDNSSGILVDDDKLDCPNAKYTNINDALTEIESNTYFGAPTIILCKGNYKAPRKIKSIPNFTLTSNYDTPVGTNIIGTIDVESIEGLTLSFINIISDTGRGIAADYIIGTQPSNIKNVTIKSSLESINAYHINTTFNILNSKFFSQNRPAIVLNGFGSDASLIENITVGNSPDDKTGNVGLEIGTDNVTINKTTIYSHADGIKIVNSPGSKITNSIIENNTIQSILVSNSPNVIIDNTKSLSNSGNGISVIDSHNIKITNSLLEAFQFEALYLSASENGYFQNNCFATSSKVYDVEIEENMSSGLFDDGVKGNYYNNADCLDADNNYICDYPFNIVVNHNHVYTDNKPQKYCNYGLYDNTSGPMFLETMKDLNPSDNKAETTSVIGTNVGITAYTKNSLSAGTGGKKEKVNLLIIADVSGSMYNRRYGGVVTLKDGTVTTKLAVTDEAIKLLVEKYSIIADVKYDLIQFSDVINRNSGWVDLTTTPVPNLVKGGGTDYYKALVETMDVAIKSQPKADKTIIYFMSDGENNEEDFYDLDFLADWFQAAVLNPDIYRLYTYGILFGGEDLNIISIPEEGYKTPDPIIMNTPEDILAELLKTLDYTIEYELTDDYGGGFYIDTYTGEVFVRDSSVFDINVDTNPKITVKAKDIINSLEIFGDFTIALTEGINTGVSNAFCDMFADTVQTREELCTTTNGIEWIGNAIIKNNPDTMLNTCNVIIPQWVQDQTVTCSTAQCQSSSKPAKATTIKYAYAPENASALSNPSSSLYNLEVITSSSTTIEDFNELKINQSDFRIDANKVTNINFLKFTKDSKIEVNPSILTDLQIGNISIDFDGSNNNIIATNNFNNIKIKNINLPAVGNDIKLKANNSIKIENIKIGTGGAIDIEAPVVTIGDLNILDKGGRTNISIRADIVNISTINFGQQITLTIKPLNNNKVLFRGNTIDFSDSSVMKLGNGFYYINQSLNIPGMYSGQSLEAIDNVVEVDLYINFDLTIGNNTAINANGNNGDYGINKPENFRMFINGDFNTGGSGTTINALLYVEGDVNLGPSTFVKGAISASNKIDINDGSELEYSLTMINSEYGACPGVATPKPAVSFFRAWDASKLKTDPTIDVKISGQSFELNIASLSEDGTGTDNVEFNFWLQDIPTGEILTVPMLHFSQNVDDIATKSFLIQNAYRNVHAIFQICSDYDNVSNQYKLFPLGDCTRICKIPLETTNEDPCIREVQSTEGFAVRPNKFVVEINDKSDNTIKLNNSTNKDSGITIKAGEAFKIKVQALDINDNPISNFNEDFTLDVKKNDVDMIEDGILTPNLLTIPSGSLTFVKGVLEFEASYNEVGFVNIGVTPNTTYAEIDQTLDNNNHIIPTDTFKAGRFIPYSFLVTNVNLKDITGNNNISNVNNCNYNYLNKQGSDLTGLSYGFNIQAINMGGEVTSNYRESFAKDTTLTYNVNWRRISKTNSTGSTSMSVNIPSSLWVNGIYSTLTGGEFITSIDVLNGVGVNRKTPFEPFAIRLNSEENFFVNNINVSDKEVTSGIDVGARSFDITALKPNTLYYVYGRINVIDGISAPNGDANINMFYEIYAKGDTTILTDMLGTPLQESVNDTNWWRNTKHSNCDNIFAEDLSITFNTGTTSIPSGNFDYTNADRDILIINDVSPNRPIETTATIDLSTHNSFLLHNPYSSKDEERFNITFIGLNVVDNNKADTVTNSGKNTANQSRFIK